MPVDLPPPKKPNLPTSVGAQFPSDRTLNWLAVVVGMGLCFWALNFGILPHRGNPPSASVPLSTTQHSTPGS